MSDRDPLGVIRHEREVVELEELFHHLTASHGCTASQALAARIVQAGQMAEARLAMAGADGRPMLDPDRLEMSIGDEMILRAVQFRDHHRHHHTVLDALGTDHFGVTDGRDAHHG